MVAENRMGRIDSTHWGASTQLGARRLWGVTTLGCFDRIPFHTSVTSGDNRENAPAAIHIVCFNPQSRVFLIKITYSDGTLALPYSMSCFFLQLYPKGMFCGLLAKNLRVHPPHSPSCKRCYGNRCQVHLFSSVSVFIVIGRNCYIWFE